MCPFKPLSELVLKCDTGINLSESCCGGVEPPLMEIFGRRYLPESAAAIRVRTALIPERAGRVSGTRCELARSRCGGGWPAPSGCSLLHTDAAFLPFG